MIHYDTICSFRTSIRVGTGERLSCRRKDEPLPSAA